MIVRGTRMTSRAVRAGFTLMEVMVVVAIILVLASVGGLVYMRHLDDANVSKARLDLKGLTTAVETYKTRYGRHPDNLALLANSQDGGAAYIDQDSQFDPWGQPYVYEPANLHPQTRKPHIYCLPPSGLNSGKPISNWDSMHPAAMNQ